MPGKSSANGVQRLGSALHHVVAHRSVNMDIHIGRYQHGLGIGIARIVPVPAKNRSDASVVDGDQRILYDFIST